MADVSQPMLHRRDFLFGAAALSLGLPALSKVATSPLSTPDVAPTGATITRAAIFPSIGISRVGNAESWFLAPEVPGLHPEPEGGFKDGPDKIKKQVQRFRVYGYDDDGRLVREITADEDRLRWTVRVANAKAAWYGFHNVLDLGEAAPGIPGALRNDFVPLDERETVLIIDSGEVTVEGAQANTSGADERFRLAGTFWNQAPVTLGHLRTDQAGRLLVFPGDGVTGSALQVNALRDFTNNDGWYDDWCDGWIKATVTLPDGTTVESEPAWVVCCGPDFAPQIPPLVSLYDVIRDVMIEMGHAVKPEPPFSFRRDVLPFFQRLGLMQWVSAADYLNLHWPMVRDFSDPDYLRQLADPSDAARDVRHGVLAAIRNPRDPNPTQDQLPYMLGDGVDYPFSPLHWFQIPVSQYEILEAWADGEFVDDLVDAQADAATSLDDLPLAQQPEALTRAALTPCSGGPFHPGVELTWPMRHRELFRGPDETEFPFRIAHGDRTELFQFVGMQLNPENVFSGIDGQGTGSPIGPQMPGDLTRWMGVPWPPDAFSCQFVLTGEDFPTPNWWPALLPVNVFPEAFHEQVLRADLSAEDRVRFFDSRVIWSRGVTGVGLHVEASYTDGLRRMVSLWPRMGMIVRRPGPTDARAPSHLPNEMYVEVQRGAMSLRSAPPPAED